MRKAIPIKSQVLIKCSKLIENIKKYKKLTNKILGSDDLILQQELKTDGSLIYSNLLSYGGSDENMLEFFIAFSWVDELSNTSLGLKIIEDWSQYNTEVKAVVESFVNSSNRNQSYFLSLLHIENLGISEDEKKELSTHTEEILVNFFSLLVNADGKIDEKEKSTYEEFKRILKLNYSSKEISKEISQKTTSGIEEILDELNNLIGLDNIKKEVFELINFVKVNQSRVSKGLQPIEVGLHSVFYGPPGTGKTTVARIISKALNQLGLLKSGQLIETDRASLVAGYVGQTAEKTLTVLKQAHGGVLFLDEAYTLLGEGNDFGQEAIDTILKYMEDNRNEIIVIVAGYEDEMNSFLESNPGLESRFNKKFYFSNFGSSELLEIFKMKLESNGFVFDNDVVSKALIKITDALMSSKTNFGNARYIRNLYEEIIQNQFSRISSLESPSEIQLRTIVPDDITNL